jgi:hypothetical protein
LAGATVEGVVISSNASGGKRVMGKVVSHRTLTISNAALQFFAVDTVDRPFATAYAQAKKELPASGTWSFELTVPTPFNQYVALPIWSSVRSGPVNRLVQRKETGWIKAMVRAGRLAVDALHCL